MFYETEIALRRQLKYPPFCDIILIGFSGDSQKEIEDISLYMFNMLKASLEKYQINVFHPMPAPIDKIQNKIRWRIIAKGVVSEEVTIILNKCLQNVYGMNLKHTKVSIDINPNNMM